MWYIYPSMNLVYHHNLSSITFMMISSLFVYPMFISGWATNSKYSLIGSIRSIAQSISYEISMIMIILIPIIMYSKMSFSMMMTTSNITWLMAPFILMMWINSILAETNRSPFDLAEGESELVSGFNTELSSVMFTMLFMAEYLNMMIMSIISTAIMTPIIKTSLFSYASFCIPAMMFLLLFLITRTSLPRMRYDNLMMLSWKSILPISIAMLLLILPMSKP